MSELVTAAAAHETQAPNSTASDTEEVAALVRREILSAEDPAALWQRPDRDGATRASDDDAKLVLALAPYPGLLRELTSAEAHGAESCDFSFGEGRTLSLVQGDAAEFERGNKAATVWECAVVLLRGYLETADGAKALRGKRVLELGAGLGLAGIACVAAGARAVVMTDLFPALPGLAANVEANLSAEEAARAHVAELTWGAEPRERQLLDAHFGGGAPDVVVASDVLYSVAAAAALVGTLLRVCGERTAVLVAYKQRRAVEGRVWEGLGRAFAIAQLRSPVLDAVAERCGVGLFELRRRPGTAGLTRAVAAEWPAWLAPPQ